MNFKRMLKIAIISSPLMLAGCVSNDNGEENAVLTNIKSGASSIGGAVSNMFNGYESGTQVSKETLLSVARGLTQEEVVNILGHPDERNEVKGRELWNYPYVRMPIFGGSTNMTTVVEFDKNDKVLRAYQSQGKGTGTAFDDYM